jgi:predicted nucleic acid-binding Zn ribbon protein
MAKDKSQKISRTQRQTRAYRIMLIIISAIILLTMILSLITK